MKGSVTRTPMRHIFQAPVGTMRMRERSTLAEEVAAEMQSLIRQGDYQPGARFPSEPELARRFGVGLSTVREAKKALELIGLVHSHPGRGTFISDNAQTMLILSDSVRGAHASIRELYESRRFIEGGLARLAAARATPEDVEAIQQALNTMEKLAAGSKEEFIEADLAFHMAVVEAAKNTFLREMYRAIRALMGEVLLEVVSYPQVQLRSLEFHKATFEAIRRRDARQAERITLTHLRDVEQRIEQYLVRDEREVRDTRKPSSPSVPGAK